MMFASKSEEKRIKTQMGAVPENDHKVDIQVWPVAGGKYGTAIKVDGKGLTAKLVNNKAEVIAFLNEVL